jgi:hypothetical protein
MVQIDFAVHRAVGSAHGSAHRVHAVLAVGVGVYDRAGELNELQVFWGECPARYVHRSTVLIPAGLAGAAAAPLAPAA